MTLVTCAGCKRTFNAEIHDMFPTLERTYYCSGCLEATHPIPSLGEILEEVKR